MANKRLCICPDCGKQFEGWPNSIYCRECAAKRHRKSQRRAMQSYRKRAKEAEKKKPVAKPVTKKPNTEQCKGCIYWRYFSASCGHGTYIRCCHYLLDTEKRREHDGDKCLSRDTNTPKKKRPWSDYT